MHRASEVQTTLVMDAITLLSQRRSADRQLSQHIVQPSTLDMSRTVRSRSRDMHFFMSSWEDSAMSTSADPSGPIRAGADEAAEEAFTSEGGHVSTSGKPAGVPAEVDPEAARLMATLGIHHDGRYYHFRNYRYTRLQDAVAYARLVATRVPYPLTEDELPAQAGNDDFKPPSASDTTLMMTLGVSFDGARYVYESYHYDRLADAVAYARLRRLHVR